MSTLLASPASVEITIKGCQYTVETIPAGEFGVSAVRVTKLVNGESYDLLRTTDGRLECSCPDFVCRHADKNTCCKHLSYAVANDLLPVAPAPVSGGSPVAVEAPKPVPVAVAPITRADLARAKMWGLKLPNAPMAVEAPASAPVEPAPVPAGWSEIEADDAPALASDDESACTLSDQSFRAWKRHQAARFVPSVLDEIEWLGMSLMLAGEPMAEIDTDNTTFLLTFAVGQMVGLEARQQDEAEERAYEAWLDERYAEAFGEPGQDWHQAERVEAVGCLVARGV